MECYGFGDADWDFAPGGELCDSAGRPGCPRERIAIGTEIEIYEFMDVPQIHGAGTGHQPESIGVHIENFPAGRKFRREMR